MGKAALANQPKAQKARFPPISLLSPSYLPPVDPPIESRDSPVPPIKAQESIDAQASLDTHDIAL
jgi:hypothetical protein